MAPRMNVAYIANVRMPTEKAHGLQIMKMCAAFSRAGRNGEALTLIVPRRFNKIKDDPFSYYGVPKTFWIVRLPALDLLPIFSGAFGFWILSFSFYISARVYLWFRKFDAVYSRDSLAGLFFTGFFYEIHNLPKRATHFHRFCWRRAQHIFAVTGLLKEDLVKFGVPVDKVTVMPDGFDSEDFANVSEKVLARKRFGLPTEKRIILYAGSFYLYGWKGVDVFLESARNFQQEAMFVLVGGDVEEIEEIKKKGVSENVRLVGRIPHSLIPDYLWSADVLVLPNTAGTAHSERYTSPLKLFEYMASGRPIVATRLPSVLEVLNEKNAVLVEPGSVSALADGIKKLLIDEKLGDNLAMEAKKDGGRYTWFTRAENILKRIKLQ